MDVEIIETGNSGDIVKRGNDLGVVYSFENMPYLAMFGGNVEESTPTQRIESSFNFDYWGNSFYPQEPSLQFNSLTENALKNTPLTSSGRLLIEDAIKADLAFMRPFATVTVSTEIIATDNLKIAIKIVKPDNLEEKEFIYIWDAASLGFLEVNYTPNENSQVVTGNGLEYGLQFGL